MDKNFRMQLVDKSCISIMYKLQKNKLNSIDKNCIYISNGAS